MCMIFYANVLLYGNFNTSKFQPDCETHMCVNICEHKTLSLSLYNINKEEFTVLFFNQKLFVHVLKL